MKVYLNKEYKCVKVEDNTFVANDSSNYIRYYFVTNANGDVIDKMDDTSVIYRNTEPSYVTVAFRRADGNVIQHLMASPKTDVTGNSFFEYEITDTDGVLYKKGALEISAQFIEATLSEAGGVKKVISQKVKAIAINTAHVLDNIGEEAEEYYSQYEQANNDAHAVLQAQITTNFNNIGTLQELTTDAKDDLVKAINEVDAHADANKSEIGNLSTLTTDEKTTIVGAINEVDAHADANKAEIGNLSALTTDEKATLVGAINEVDNHADNATTTANNAVATANSAVATANEAKTTAQTAENNANSAVDTANAANATADEAKAIAQGSQRAIGFATLQAAITALNGYSNTQLKVGDNVYIVETGVPDLWVAAVEQNSVAYNYTTNDAFNDDLVENTLVQVGYYKFAYLESDGKPCTVAWQNMTVAASDWVASTEFEDFAYEAKIALSDFVNFSSIPQVVFGLTEATSGNYAPICKAGDKGVYIYSKVNTAITLPTVVTFAPNVHGASMQGGGYTNKGKWVASTTYAIDDLVYTDNGQYVCIEGITSTTSPEQDTTHWQATFVATGKTKNALTISGQDNGTEVQKAFDGSQAVEIAFDENTMTAKEVNGVLKVGAKGTIPEALPQEASALTSGELPTTGWTATVLPLWEGTVNVQGSYKGVVILPPNSLNFNKLKQYTTKSDWQIWTNKSSTYEAPVLVSVSSSEIMIGDNDKSFKIKSDGSLYGYNGSSSDIVYKGLKCLAISRYTFSISDANITVNSDVLMELTDEGMVTAYALANGNIQVIRDAMPTYPIQYTYKVKQTNATGQFTLLNHYVADVPTSLPQETSAVKNGSLPTSGWEKTGFQTFWEGAANCDASTYKPIGTSKELADILYSDDSAYPMVDYNYQYYGNYNETNVKFSYKNSNASVGDLTGISFRDGSQVDNPTIFIARDGTMYGRGSNFSSSAYAVTYTRIGTSTISQQLYTISDSDITANSDVLMELTDNGGVKALSIEAGKITVVRDSAPTSAIPYTYKVKQTNASGQFTLVNHFVPSIPDSPTSLPVSYKKVSGSLPTSGWGDTAAPLLVSGEKTIGSDSVDIGNIGENNAALQSGWKVTVTGTINNTYIQGASSGSPRIDLYKNSGYSSYILRNQYNSQDFGINIYPDGRVNIFAKQTGNYNITIYNTTNVSKTYTISDTSITANTSVKMYLTDKGGVKAYSKAVGSIQVIRDSVPTTAIPYEYEVEQTSAEGLFEVINAYVPAVPTKTSQLTNDSGFITAADIPSAGEWVIVNDDIPKATITEAGTYQVVVNFDVFDGSSQEIQTASCEIYFDSLHKARGTSSVSYSYSSEPRLSVGTYTPVIISENNGFVLRVESWLYIIENTALNVYSQPTYAKFKYRKIN